jgi:hypothetical protein
MQHAIDLKRSHLNKSFLKSTCAKAGGMLADGMQDEEQNTGKAIRCVPEVVVEVIA